MTDFARLLGALSQHDVGFVIIGGFAAIAHGSAFLTVDLDIVYERSADNVERLVRARQAEGPGADRRARVAADRE